MESSRQVFFPLHRVLSVHVSPDFPTPVTGFTCFSTPSDVPVLSWTVMTRQPTLWSSLRMVFFGYSRVRAGSTFAGPNGIACAPATTVPAIAQETMKSTWRAGGFCSDMTGRMKSFT